MRIEIDKIGTAAVTCVEDIPVQDWDLDRDDIKFKGLINLTAVFVRVPLAIEVTAQAKVNNEIACARCLRLFSQSLSYDFKKLYDYDSLTGGYLEIDADVREEILLNFSMKVLCKSDCKGLCQGCGADLNLEQCRC